MSRGAPDGYQWNTPEVFRQSEGVYVYAYELATDPNTAKLSPLATDLVMVKGFVTRVRLRIPGGHSGLTGLSLDNEAGPILPKGAWTYLIGDDEVLDFNTDYDVTEWDGDFKIKAHTYNLDDTYIHTHHLQLQIIGYPG